MTLKSAIFLAALILVGCSRRQGDSSPQDAAALRFGYSGMARIDADTFVVAHDAKTGQSGPRLGIVHHALQAKPVYQSLRWDGAVLPSDLESICAIPGRPGEFLAVESGHRAGKGLIFHLKIDNDEAGWHVQLQGMLRLPGNVEDVEGTLCLRRKDGKLLLVLGERGGTKTNRAGRLRWGEIVLGRDSVTLDWPESDKVDLQPLPGHGKGWRGCTDLWLDENGVLWVAAAYDPGKSGPFRSAIVRVGRIDVDHPPRPIVLDATPEVVLALEGVKIEGLVGLSVLSFLIATDDENRGGTWRIVTIGK